LLSVINTFLENRRSGKNKNQSDNSTKLLAAAAAAELIDFFAFN